MSTSSSSSPDRPQTVYTAMAIVVFALCAFIGLKFPVITVPLMVILLIIGRVGMKQEKGTVVWHLTRGALAASILLAAVVAVDLIRALFARS